MKRFICIHGHFYQPPRENPWLEEIELQDSAHPYRDWNERISAECYAPNTASRILDAKSRIIDIVNNYAKISFNFGPTLLTWLERFQPEVYRAVLEADQVSRQNFNGHGAALAQAYNHMIMPLANARDKRTQIYWGIKDFEFRFKRFPEGMWLPETAVDTATLEVLAEFGIKFTVLAPRQAKRARKLDDKHWKEVHESTLDPQRPYLCRLPSGRSIVIFFYDGPIAQDIAFGGLLNNGENMARRLLEAFPRESEEKRLVHVATDGETYGHHHRFGNMALSYCLHFIESKRFAQITVFGEFLENTPVTHEVEIIENSSWSCVHGVERWRSNCSCRIGFHCAWNQQWRKPLREAMDWLRDELVPVYEQEMLGFVQDPWAARDEYIEVVLERDPARVENFLRRIANRELSKSDQIKVLKLLEMQRHAMFIYTSCGWFFDDVSGIETIQIMQYAARAIQLTKEITGLDLEAEYIRRLETAVSNVTGHKSGAEIYRKQIKPTVVDLLNVGAHYAIASLFDEYPAQMRIYSYEVTLHDQKRYEAGKQKLLVGKAGIRSLITFEECVIDFCVVHLGDYNLNGGVRHYNGDEAFELMRRQLKESFMQNDIPELIGLMKEHFGRHNYTLWDLFKNEQGKVLNQVFDNTLASIETHFREIYEHYYPLMQIRPDIHIPLPKALAMTVEFILNRDLVEVLEHDPLDVEKLETLAREINRWNFTRNKETLGYVASRRVDALMEEFAVDYKELSRLKRLCEVLQILSTLAIQLDLWKSQNIYFSLSKRLNGQLLHPDPRAQLSASWMEYFNELGIYLNVRNE